MNRRHFDLPYDAFIYELRTYYNKKAKRNAFNMKNVEECVKFSAERLKKRFSFLQENEFACTLEDMISDSEKLRLEQLKDATPIDWKSIKEISEFLLEFSTLLAVEMRNRFDKTVGS